MVTASDPDFTWLPDLALRTLGGAVIWANDEAFAEKENLITPGAPGFTAAHFGHRGQVYDGWETRRRRTAGHDEAIVRLGVPGTVRGIVVDTAWFTGNYPPEISVDALEVDDPRPAAGLAAADGWQPLVVRSGVAGDTRNAFAVESDARWTHVRLRMYPDGGVARLRVHGEPRPDPRYLRLGLLDLAALENGGLVLDCSNRFYGSPQNLIFPGVARAMGDGWETARRRDDANDWVLIQLAGAGVPALIEIDTSYFIGNCPGAASVTGFAAGGTPVDILARTDLQPDTRHRFLVAPGPAVESVRLDVFPDGGLARMRVWGELT